MPDIEGAQRSGGLARLRTVLWVVAGVVALLGAALAYDQSHPVSSTATGSTARFGGAFTLTATDGTVVTEQSLAGKPFAIFFGFTRCPDVCPTSLSRMARLRQQLGPDGMKFEIVFVSVDPGHDTPGSLAKYLELFGTPIIGLTGTEPQLDQIKRGFGIYSAKVPQPGGDYTIDHTASIFLINAAGDLAGTIDYNEGDPSALAKLRQLIG